MQTIIDTNDLERALNRGSKIRITGDFVVEFFNSEDDETTRTKPGPKNLPTATVPAKTFHQPIIDALKDGPLSSEEIRKRLPDIDGATPNIISWALVDVQFEGLRRGKNKNGPVTKLDDGRYALSKNM